MLNKKRLMASLMASAMMVSSAVACGSSDDKSTTAAPVETKAPETQATTEPTQAPTQATTEEQKPVVNYEEGKAVTFEDSKTGFVQLWDTKKDWDEAEIEIVDYNGSKAVKIASKNNESSKSQYIAVDVVSLLGANIDKLAEIQFDLAVEAKDGNFYACAFTVAPTIDGKEVSVPIYSQRVNPKTVSVKVEEGTYTADEANVMIIKKNSNTAGNNKDVAYGETGAYSTIYLDNIRFLDKDGNFLDVDTSAEFNAPEAFAGSNGPDYSNIGIVTDAVVFPDFVKSGNGWAQDGLEMPEDILKAMVPGSVVEVEFTSENGDLWMVMPDAAAGWSRIAQGSAYINGSKNICQITYEQIVAVVGEDQSQWGARMQFEASGAWQVTGVKVGKQANVVTVTDAVDFPDFVKSGNGWAQDGLEMPEEILKALVPGSVVEVEFTSETGEIWIVFPDAAAGWSRIAQNKALCYGGKAYITYDQIVEVVGEDQSQWGARMQFEASSAWQVTSVRVGKQGEMKMINNAVEFPDFVKSGSGWGQDGLEMPEAILKALVPGSVVQVEFTSETGEIWIVFPDAAAGWSRIAQFQAAVNNGIAQITYDQIVAVVGEDQSQWGARMQFEASSAWQVTSVVVGQAK